MNSGSGAAVKISVVIITFNEERNIGRCLRSVARVADDIVVLDSGSRDETGNICRRFGVRFYEQPFLAYDLQKNDAVLKAAYDHILSLDADEALTPELERSILKAKDWWSADAFAFNRLTAFCGKWVKHGEWYPDRVVRLFDRRKAWWSGALHEKLEFRGQPDIVFLRGRLLHYSYYSLFHYLRKTQLYTQVTATQLFGKGIRPWAYHFYIKPFYRFFRAYIFRMGFLDGRTGYLIARLTAQRLFLQFVKVKRLREKNKGR